MNKKSSTSPNLRRVFVALTCDDVASAISKTLEGDVIISDLYCPPHLGVTINPTIRADIELDLVSQVKNFFTNAFPGTQNIKYGYANNFYECSVRPIVKFISTIKAITEGNTKNFEFYLPHKEMISRRTSSYYMAEGESIGIHFYDRHSAILPYLIDYLERNKHKIIYDCWRAPKPTFYYNVLRLGVVYIGRLYQDVKNWFQSAQVSYIGSKPFKRIFIVRTVGQANTIIPYLTNSTLDILVVNISSGLDDSHALLKPIALRKNVTVVTARQVGLKFILMTYLMSLINVLRQKKIYFMFDDITLNVTQALREVEVMSAKLLCYQETLSATLNEVDINKDSLLFSLEQKSPHAWVDSLIARNHTVKPVQVKQCNQLALPLPEPVFSDLYLCDSPAVMNMFHKSWPDHVNKVKYIGTMSMISAPTSLQDDIPGENLVWNAGQPRKICFFSGVYSSVNLETLNALRHLQRKINIEFVVKLHPRDTFLYHKVFPEFQFISEQHNLFLEFTNQFDLALTYPSGVVMDLISSGLPFILLTPNHNDYHNVKVDPGLRKIIQITSNHDLDHWLSDIQSVISNHPQALEYFHQQSDLIIDIHEIERQLALLTK